MAPDALLGLNKEARAIVQILAHTGARPKEICCLQSDDILLSDETPHIKIRFKEGQELKTIYSERDIPLLEDTLAIFQSYLDGFPRYYNRSDTFTAAVNKYLRENSIINSKEYSLYSLRHSFQDRMTAVDMPDRVQCELFGHKFSRPKYGSGPSLKLKKEWLKKIQIVI